MKTKFLINFPAIQSQEPVVYNLIADYNLKVNILKASIDINLQGHMLAEIDGQSDKISEAIEYLEKIGIEVDFVKSTIHRIENKCVDCGLCTAVCGSKALRIGNDTGWKLEYEDSRCVGCNLCIQACPLQAITNEVGIGC
jgi:ferredoxin